MFNSKYVLRKMICLGVWNAAAEKKELFLGLEKDKEDFK